MEPLKIPRIPVEASKQIKSYGWADGTLVIEFKSGGIYRYADVPKNVFDDFCACDSKGSFLHHHIKSVYPYAKLEQPKEEGDGVSQ